MEGFFCLKLGAGMPPMARPRQQAGGGEAAAAAAH